MLDLYERFRGAARNDSLFVPRLLTLFWALALVVFASSLQDEQGTVVELGLSIASFTYGALLGVFVLGVLNPRTAQSDALIAFAVTIAALVCAVFGVWHSASEGWLFEFAPTDAEVLRRGLSPIAWPWFPVIGALISLLVGSLSALLRGARAVHSASG